MNSIVAESRNLTCSDSRKQIVLDWKIDSVMEEHLTSLGMFLLSIA